MKGLLRTLFPLSSLMLAACVNRPAVNDWSQWGTDTPEPKHTYSRTESSELREIIDCLGAGILVAVIIVLLK
ncbi:hypothetical protein [Thiomonas sp.]